MVHQNLAARANTSSVLDEVSISGPSSRSLKPGELEMVACDPTVAMLIAVVLVEVLYTVATSA